MRQQHLLPINFRIIYKLLVTTHFAFSQNPDIPREINKAIFKSENIALSIETTKSTLN